MSLGPARGTVLQRVFDTFAFVVIFMGVETMLGGHLWLGAVLCGLGPIFYALSTVTS